MNMRTNKMKINQHENLLNSPVIYEGRGDTINTTLQCLRTTMMSSCCAQ